MPQQFQVRFVQIPRWLIILAGAFAVAFGVALVLLSLTVFIILLPVLLVAGALYYLFGLPRSRRNGRRETGDQVIEGEYRELEPERVERNRDDAR